MPFKRDKRYNLPSYYGIVKEHSNQVILTADNLVLHGSRGTLDGRCKGCLQVIIGSVGGFLGQLQGPLKHARCTINYKENAILSQ